MFSFLRGVDPKRTKVSHLTTFTMEDGRSSVSFHNDPNLSSQQASIAFTLPPASEGPNPKDNSIMIPPFHAHPKQQEIFHVVKGTALFHLNQEKITKAAGNELVVPRGVYHKFTNQSTTESMTLEAHYDPPELVREERFFRNLCGYLQDVTKGGAGMLESASTAQLALFAWEADMPICEPVVALNVPKAIGIPIAYALTWVLGVFVGKWLLGYKGSYEEYYHEASE